MRKKNNLNQKLSSFIVLLCALAILIIYSLDLKNDYYFHSTKKKTTAEIEQIEKVQEYKPYILTLGYSNENTKQLEKCVLKLDGRFGGKISEENLKNVELFYTEQSPCDIHIEGYKVPTIGGLILHLIIFLITFLAVIIFTKKVFAKAE